MGKFNRRDKMPGHGSFENRANVSSSMKTNSKAMKRARLSPYFSDPLLIPRINQFLADSKDKVYVDIDDMVNELQLRYRDYARRKRNAFKQLVEKAFAVVLQQWELGQGSFAQSSAVSGYVESTENSSSEVEECNVSDGDDDKSVTSSNNQLVNLYKPSQLQAMTKQFQRCPNENAELIDLSSDDDSSKKKESSEEKGQPEAQSNGLQQNHMFSRETTVTVIHGNASKSGQKFPAKSSERPQITITKKHKLSSQGEKNLSFLAKKRKEPPQESTITFANFGGNAKVLEEVCKLILHIRHPELYKQIGVSSPRGFLLHGPPGCGKTLLATAIAGELDVSLIKVSAPELIGGVSGESEERIRELFEKAIQSAPCVLFIDEVDAVTPHRQNAQREMERRIVAQLLTCLDELNNKPGGDQVLVIGATNRPDSLDPALRRAGRFDREVCLGIPDLKAREQILKVLCCNIKMPDNFDFEELAQNTPGFVGADLLALTREAAMAAINRAFAALHHKKKERSRPKNKRMRLDKAIVRSSVLGDAKKQENDNEVNMEVDEIECEKKKEDTIGKEVIDCSKENSEEKSQGEKLKDRDKETKSEKSKNEIEIEVSHEPDSKNEKVKEHLKDSEEKDSVEVTETPVKEHSTEEKKIDKISNDNKGKEKDRSSTKDDSDMDIAETASEESVNCEQKDDSLKEGSTKTVESEDESEVEIIPEVNDPTPPSLETLVSWIRDIPPLTFRQLKSLHVTKEDFNKALRCVQPSAKREGFATVPDVTWDDIGSLSDVREELKMSILGPVKFRKQFEQLGLTAPAGILICGPPGCGKTLLAKAVANEAGINFISVKGPELLNMYVGESERAVRQCFQRARNSAPCVIFFDELDALCPRRSDSGENGASMRVVNQMLTEMDGVEDRREVFLMAATNRPDIIDPAVLRPGRLDKILYVGLPGPDDRVDILRALTKGGTKPKLSENVDLSEIARREECNGYSGADLAALVKEAGVQALRDLVAMSQLDPNADVSVSLEHFEKSLRVVRPSVSLEDQKYYTLQRKKYSSNRFV